MGKHKKRSVVNHNAKGKKRQTGIEDLEAALGKSSKEKDDFVSSKSTIETTTSDPVSIKPRGLLNLGNSCFLNAILQCLCAVNQLADVHDNCNSQMFHLLLKTICEANVPAKGPVNPSGLFSCVGSTLKQFKNRRQQDSHELFVCLLNHIEEDLTKANATANEAAAGFISRYKGELFSMVCCSNCGQRSAVCESWFALSVEIPGSESLNKYPDFKTRPIRGNPKKGKADVRKEIVIQSATAEINSEKDAKESEGNSAETKEVDQVECNLQVIDAASEEGCLDFDEKKGCKSADLTNTIEALGELSLNPEQNLPGNSSSDSDSRQKASNSDKTAVLLAENIVEPVDPIDSGVPNSLSLEDCLRKFIRSEQLRVVEGNGFECIGCCVREPNVDNQRSVVDASKRLMLHKLPRTLVIHLKRLLPGGKQTVTVKLPLELEMSEFTATVRNCGPMTKDNGIAYTLMGVIVHQGGAFGGHYVAYVKREGCWFYASDTSVRVSSVSEVLGAQAYMAFYTKFDRS